MPASERKVPAKAVVGVFSVNEPMPSLMTVPAPTKTPVADRSLATCSVPLAAAVSAAESVSSRVTRLMPVMVVPSGIPVPTTTWPLARPVTSPTMRLLVPMAPLVMVLSSWTLSRAVAPARTVMSPVDAPAQPAEARSVPVRTKVPPVWVREPPAVRTLEPARISSWPTPETAPV